MTDKLTYDENLARLDSVRSERDSEKDKLVLAKAEMGDLKQVELTGTIPYMFAGVGKKNSDKIQKVLEFKKSKDEDGEYTKGAKKTLEKIKEKAKTLRTTSPEIGKSLSLYLTSLKAWADGAGISEIDAWILQDEAFGCQTVMIRGENGEVFLGHTEEWYMDPDEKESIEVVPEWTTFINTTDPDNPDKLEAFTGYPFALPGSSFGVHNGKLMAVDSLEVRRTGKSIPANVAAWVAWDLAGKVEPEEIFKALGPFADGYAYNEIGFNADTQTVEAKKIEFAGAQMSTVFLTKSPMEYMVQTNMAETTLVDRKTKLDEEDREYYEGIRKTHIAIRQVWLERFRKLKSKGKATPEFSIDSLAKEFSLITNNPNLLTIPQEYTYAHMFAVVKNDGTIQTRINSGPALPSSGN